MEVERRLLLEKVYVYAQRLTCVPACSYMPQEDRLNAALTVYENLEFALRLSDATLNRQARATV